MGTNYYARLKDKKLNKLFGDLHIGKSSCGWYFGLHVYPDKEINTLEDWRTKVFTNDQIEIVDEYNHSVTVDEMIGCITNRSRENDDRVSVERMREGLKDRGMERFALDEKRKLYYNPMHDDFCLGTAEDGKPYSLFIRDFS